MNALIDLWTRWRLKRAVSRSLDHIPKDFGGGCPVDKALKMAELIRRFRLRTTVDVGVYRGRSFFPQAFTHRLTTGGCVYGVDPYGREEARQFDRPDLREQLDHFVRNTDFDGIHQSVLERIADWSLGSHAILLRQTSLQAAESFREKRKTCHLVHIDGNHDTECVTADVQAYVGLLAPDAFLVLDDVDWDSVKPAYRWVAEQMEVVFENNLYAVFCTKKSRWIPSARIALAGIG